MTDVGSPVSDFSIAFYPPGLLPLAAFCLLLGLSLAAAAWLGWRYYLRQHGVLAEGTVTQSLVRTGRASSGEFSASVRTYSRTLTIAYRDAAGATHVIPGFHYSMDGDDGSPGAPRVGGKVPVYYSPAHPGLGVYFNPRWHYTVPLLALALLLPLLWMAASFCYRDLRVQNSLALGGWSEDEYQRYQDVIIESGSQLYQEPGNADALERRADAQFAIVQFGDAITDYDAALRLRPDDKGLLRKRAQAEWLEGRDMDALRDWLRSR